MIISIKTTDPLDAGPVNLHSRWDMLDWGRLAQRVFVNIAISGYWKVDETGLMKRTFLIGDAVPGIAFTLDMRKMNNGELHDIYQKLRTKQSEQKMHYSISDKNTSIAIISNRMKPAMQKDTHLTLSKLG